MIAILSADTIKRWDSYTIEREPVSSVDLMERAATACCDWLLDKYKDSIQFTVFCGTGNNGGDGLGIARKLIQAGKKVSIVIAGDSQFGSGEFTFNLHKLNQLSNFELLLEPSQLPHLHSDDIVIDALFGTGLNRAVSGFAQNCIQHINGSEARVIAIDMPSGLFADQASPVDSPIVSATYTLSFQVPKLAFFIPENDAYVGQFILLDIGLKSDFEAYRHPENAFLQYSDLKGVFSKRVRHANKWQFGHALLIAGSEDKIGAAIIASRSALRSGIGLLTVHTVKAASMPIISAIPEAMLSLDDSSSHITQCPSLEKYSAVGIGPGIGWHPETAECIKKLLQSGFSNLVLDADAINLIAEHKWQDMLPPNCLLTPHIKEFERLAGASSNGFERLEMQKTFSKRHGVYVLLKGAYSSVSTPDGKLFFNSSGNPGMAKGGSGDCLTGILTALMAQGFNTEKAATVGMMVHGLAGDLARDIYGETAMLASDIIEALPSIYDSLPE